MDRLKSLGFLQGKVGLYFAVASGRGFSLWKNYLLMYVMTLFLSGKMAVWVEYQGQDLYGSDYVS